MKLRIAGARLLDPGVALDAVGDLCIADGTIVATGAVPDGFTPDREIDAAGQIACPGLVDLSARLREPGGERTATVASESRAAARGGITTLLCPPDTTPVIDTPAVVELIHQRVAASGLARVELLGALTRELDGQNLAAMGALAAAGCAGVTNAKVPVRDTEMMRRALEYADTFGLTVHIEPEDPWLADGRQVHEGNVSTRLGLPGIPAVAETIALSRDLLLIEHTRARAHFGRLSSGGSVDLIARARADGLPVSADVAVHNLLLDEDAVAGFDGSVHVRPPLRSAGDRARLLAGVADGTLTAICSDHQPHERDAKLEPFPLTEPGVSGLDTLLALVCSLAHDGALDLATGVRALTRGPGRVLGGRCGTLDVGAPGDVCVFDPTHRWRLEEGEMASRGRNTPLLGRELHGRVTLTVLDGRIVHEL